MAKPAQDARNEAGRDGGRRISAFGRSVPMPRSRFLRITLGCLLILFGLFGFLPVLGFWMIPAGLLVLSYEFAFVRRQRRRLELWWARRRAAPR